MVHTTAQKTADGSPVSTNGDRFLRLSIEADTDSSQDEAEKVDYAAVNVVKTSTKTYAKAVTRESSKDVFFRNSTIFYLTASVLRRRYQGDATRWLPPNPPSLVLTEGVRGSHRLAPMMPKGFYN